MRSRGQSPLLPYTNAQRLPSKAMRIGRTSAATRVFVFTAALVCVLYGGYAALGYFGEDGASNTKEHIGSSGRGLSAHEEVAQLQGKNAPKLDRQYGHEENAQLQMQGQGHEKSPDIYSSGISADQAARAADSVEKVLDLRLDEPSGLYTMTAEDIDGKLTSLSDFAGKVSLVVNVASECGYTDSNYKGLQALYTKYRASGFEVLAFPCNSFGKQEPGSSQTIKDFARVQYGVNFPLFKKVEVTGPDADPIFKFLRETGPQSQGLTELWEAKWNFSKWLVNKQGFPVKHYSSEFDTQQLERDIAAEILKAT